MQMAVLKWCRDHGCAKQRNARRVRNAYAGTSQKRARPCSSGTRSRWNTICRSAVGASAVGAKADGEHRERLGGSCSSLGLARRLGSRSFVFRLSSAVTPETYQERDGGRLGERPRQAVLGAWLSHACGCVVFSFFFFAAVAVAKPTATAAWYTTGMHRITCRAPALDGESVFGNNRGWESLTKYMYFAIVCTDEV